jgi:hypothetical protein
MNKIFKRFLLFILCFSSSLLLAQNVGINTTGATPSTNAVLDLNTGNSNNMGVIIPSVTLGAALTTFNPPMAHPATAADAGMLVYNSLATNQPVGFYYWNGATWVLISINTFVNNGLSLSGNFVQLGGNNLIQNTNIPLNGNSLTITGSSQTNTIVSNGDYGLGTAAPKNSLDVNGSVALGTYAGSNAAPAGTSLISSGQVGIGTPTPNASAALDIESTTKGFLPPQVTTAQMNAIAAPATGLMVYNTTTGCVEYYTGLVWDQLGCPCSAPPATPGPITGSTTACASSTVQVYSITPVFGAYFYSWAVPVGSSIVSGQGTTSISVDFGTTSGTISVSATNSCGTSAVNSVAVTLTPTPAITVQPGSPTLCTTGTANFSVTATGTGLTYQWYEFATSWVAIANGGKYAGATSNSLTITNPTAAMNGYQYECIVSGTCTPSVTSTPVTMTVNSLPAITTQPSSISVCNNANTTFQVAATGTALTYQWNESTNGGTTWFALSNSGVFSGVTTATLTLTSPTTGMSGTEYQCVVSGTCAPSATSSAATLTVNAAPVITSQPTSPASICPTGVATFTVAATGTALTYQWEQFITGWNPIANGGMFSGATTPTLTVTNPTAAMNGYLYECIVSGTGPCSVTTNGTATLTVQEPNVPITLTNSQATATSGNFQVKITVNSTTYAAYESSGLQNVEFSTQPGGQGTILYAWIESGATSASTSTVYWVNLSGNTIAASGGTLTIYMNFMQGPVMTGAAGYTGVAPQLFGGGYYATSYAQYDNGGEVFPAYYDNFKGTTVSPSYNLASTDGAGCTVTQNNGITVTTNGATTYGGLIYGPGCSNSPVSEFDADVTALSGIAAGIALQSGSSQTSNSIVLDFWNGSANIGNMQGGLGGDNNPNLLIGIGIMGGVAAAANSQIWYENYVTTAGNNAFALPATFYPSFGEYFSSASSSITLQWARVHQYPPSGVMPSAAFGAVETCP